MMERRRFLVVRLGAMGDIIHVLPAAASLKQSFPNSFVAWAVEERWAPLLEGNPFLDELIPVNRRSLGELLDLRRRLRSARFDTALDMQGLLKSAIVATIARPERIYGPHRSAAREPLAALFYSATFRPRSPHVVDQHMELVATAGATVRARLFPIPAGRPEGRLPEGPFVLASPTAGWVGKQWPVENYSELADKLRDAGYALVVNAPTPLDVPGAWPHASGLPGLIHATRCAAAVIGLDSGPLHLAAAIGKPGVAIFGPTDPARNGPYGGSIRVLRHADTETSYKRSSEFHSSMLAITPGEVWAALEPQLRT